YVWFDSLNRYYLAEEASELARCFESAPASFDDALQFRNGKPALVDGAHPDHRLASLLAGNAMTHLPLVGREVLVELVTADIAAAALEAPASADANPGAVGRQRCGGKTCGFPPARACARSTPPSSTATNSAPPAAGFPPAMPGNGPFRRFGLPGPRRIRYTA